MGFPGHGHTNPTLALVWELVNRGEEIIYYNTEEFQGKIERTGAVFRPYQIPNPDTIAQLDGVSLAELRQGSIRTLDDVIPDLVQSTALYAEIMVKSPLDLTEAAREIRPDYVIHDSYANWGKVIARRLGVPAVSSVTTFAYCDRIMDEHPVFMIKDVLSMTDDYLKDIPATRKQLKQVSGVIARLYNVENYDCLDFTFSQEPLNIVYTSREFQLYGELFDSRFKFVGPSLFPREGEESFFWDKFQGKNLIYISLGTVLTKHYDYQELYWKFFEVFRDSIYEVVLVVGGIEIGTLGEIPPNFTIRNRVPQLEVLKRASLFITHAGMNSVNEALYYEVPLLVIPQAFDQVMVARRVEELKAGINIPELDFSAARIREAASQILNDESYRSYSRKIGASLRAAGGYQRAADEIFAYQARNYQTHN